MGYSTDLLARSPESVLVGLSRTGDRGAFAELMKRRQAWIRNLMRRCSGDATLADDLSQQAFMQAWKSIRQLHDIERFGPWLKRLAINTWLQHARRQDPLRMADEHADADSTHTDQTGVGMDLDAALATLPHDVRLCIVLCYHERMTHTEIESFTGMRLGTIKSHIRRGTKRLQETLAAYATTPEETR
ncbi:MAG: RNA polymerase sigma factor [Gammaproteobacteria bacterium]|nr:RNA polymerase sigma factor [Gammaproteobacteria bacterium]MDH5617115.1 RNA polymerase sigma factor [Gammaproteobacteria bacterium]